jgi:predicted AAA+ superfamily ATPase
LAIPQKGKRTPPLVIVDEVQKAPEILNVAQDLIDSKKARFVLTGSSARKLKKGHEINLLPGRVVSLRLDPLTLEEDTPMKVEEVLLNGSLPAIRKLSSQTDKESDLRSYVETYLEEEIRQEAIVRNIGTFSRFLELAALESGRISNFSRIAQDIGISPITIQSYFEILVDCLVAERVEPITQSATRKKLTKAGRYLIFDMGVRRLAAGEGTQLHPERMGELLEHFVGLELIRLCRLHHPSARIRFWRDPGGPEVDWVLDLNGKYTPIEVKWTDRPTERHIRHLKVFMEEYPSSRGYVVCLAPRRMQLAEKITAIPWTEITPLLEL